MLVLWSRTLMNRSILILTTLSLIRLTHISRPCFENKTYSKYTQLSLEEVYVRTVRRIQKTTLGHIYYYI